MTAVLHHAQQEYRFGAVLGDKTFGDARVLRLLHDLEHFFVAEQKRKRRAIAFGQESRQRNHRSDVFVIFERAVELPHLFISGVGI